ncbi:uncharacterized protein LOC144806068 isoform X2 [Lissotriton helveticus]
MKPQSVIAADGAKPRSKHITKTDPWETGLDELDEGPDAFKWAFSEEEETTPPTYVATPGLDKPPEARYRGCDITPEEEQARSGVGERLERSGEGDYQEQRGNPEEHRGGEGERYGVPGGQRPHEPPCHSPRGGAWLTQTDPWETGLDELDEGPDAFKWAFSEEEETTPPTYVATPGLDKPPEARYRGCDITPEEEQARSGVGERLERSREGDYQEQRGNPEEHRGGEGERYGVPGGQRPHEPPCHSPRGGAWLTQVFHFSPLGEPRPPSSLGQKENTQVIEITDEESKI